MDETERPVVLMFVSFPLAEGIWTAPALVDLETAYELKQRGWLCIGPDPQSIDQLDAWLAAQQWLKRFD